MRLRGRMEVCERTMNRCVDSSDLKKSGVVEMNDDCGTELGELLRTLEIGVLVDENEASRSYFVV